MITTRAYYHPETAQWVAVISYPNPTYASDCLHPFFVLREELPPERYGMDGRGDSPQAAIANAHRRMRDALAGTRCTVGKLRGKDRNWEAIAERKLSYREW